MYIILQLLFTITLSFVINITIPNGNTAQSISIQTYQILQLAIDMSSFTLPFEFNESILDLKIDNTIVKTFNSSFSIKLSSRKESDIVIQIATSTALDNYLVNKTDIQQSLILAAAQISSTTAIYSPSRGSLGNPNLNPIIISQSLLTDYLLPFNMPEMADYNIEYSDQTMTFTQLGQEYWQEYTDQDISLVVISWLPFFGNCDYGEYLYLYNLIENARYCSLIDEENTKVVNVIPTSGLNPRGDQCNFQLQCSYLENLTAEYEGNKWWQADSQDLFYIGKQALNYQFIFSNNNDIKSSYFTNLITNQDDSIIPVKFQTKGVLRSSVPTKFTLEIYYNQVSNTEKEIVSAQVIASEYKAIEDSQSQYILQIKFEAMDYLQLINSFQFDILIYLVLYAVIGLITVIGIILLWLLNKTLSSVLNPPKLRIYSTFQVAFIPAIMGCFRATIPIVLFVLFLDLISGSNGAFGSIFYKYDSMDISSDQAQIQEKGRIGLLLVISGIYLSKIGSKLINPQPNDDELALIKTNVEKTSKEKIYDISEQQVDEDNLRESTFKQDEIRENQPKIIQFENQTHFGHSRQNTIISRVPGSAPPPINNLSMPPKKSTFRKPSIFKALNNSIRDNNSQREDVSPDPVQRGGTSSLEKKESISSIKREIQEEEQDLIKLIVNSLTSKDYHYQFICIFTAFTMLFLLGFSYMSLFYKNIFYFLIVLQFFDSIFYWILCNYLLEELMLVEPLMACLEVTQFIMFLAAETLQDFIYSYLMRLALIVLFRTYVNPILRNYDHFLLKIVKLIQIFYPQIKLPKESNEIKDKILSFYLGEHTDAKFTEEQAIEYVIQMTLSFSSKVHATFLKPIMLILIKIFQRQTQIPNKYQIGFREFDYYIYFGFVVIFPQILIDIYVLNSLELIYGYKLFDYFDYCKYRNDFRIDKIFEHSLNLDRSLIKEYRSTDNMKFTDQFYFNGSFIIYSILLIVLGCTIISTNKYTLYEDPVIFLMLMFLFFVLYVLKFIIQYIWNKLDVWKLRDMKQKINLDSLEEFLNPTKENLEQIIEVETIKKHFIKLNKEFLINNLNLFINAEMFLQQEEFLLQTYQLLINEEKKVQKELLRNQQIIKKQKELELKSRKKPNKKLTTEQSYSQKSNKDSEELIYQQKTITLKKSKIEPLRQILSIWYYRSKQNMFLKSLVSDVVQMHQAEHCKRCGLDIELRVVEIIPFEQMANHFKFRIIGTPFNKFEWIRYYEAHQKFVTLCIDCETSYKTKLLQRQHQTANDVLKMTQQNSLAKAIVYKWMYMARSQLLHNKHKNTQFE